MIQSSGNVLLEAADKVLACGSFTSKVLFATCFDTEPEEPGTGTDSLLKVIPGRFFCNKAFVVFFFLGEKSEYC